MKADLYSAQHALGCCNMFAHVNLVLIQSTCVPILNIQARLLLKLYFAQTNLYLRQSDICALQASTCLSQRSSLTQSCMLKYRFIILRY